MGRMGVREIGASGNGERRGGPEHVGMGERLGFHVGEDREADVQRRSRKLENRGSIKVTG